MPSAKQRHDNFSSILKYSIVGVIGTVIDLLITIYSVEKFRLDVLSAATVAFSITAIHNHCWNRYWTFRFRKRVKRKTAVKVLLTTMLGLGLTVGLMWVLVFRVGIHYQEAKLLTSIFVLSTNFLMNKWWVFSIAQDIAVHSITPQYDVSVVIPAYNEEKRIDGNLKAIQSFFRSSKFKTQIIVVNDGSSDQTVKFAKDALANFLSFRILSHQKNLGKGAAIRTGVMASSARYILISDADGSTPIEEFLSLHKAMNESRCDIAVGSRYLNQSKIKQKQPFYRVAIGRIGNLLIRLFLMDGIHDTQCGFKLFQCTAARDIFSRSKISGWGFDIEALAIAKMLNFKISEVPVVWQDCPGSRLRPFRDALKTLLELIYIKLNIWSGRYEKISNANN